MSSIPGYTLEAFLAWQNNLIVEGEGENNVSRGMAESIGAAVRRPVLSKVQFKPLVAMYEPYREIIEARLMDFNEETQSWRGYAEYVDADVPETVEQVARRYIHNLSHPQTQTMSKFYKKGEYRKLNETEITELLAMRPRPANGLKPVDLEERILYVAFDVLLSPEGNPSTTVCRIYLTPTFSVMGHSNVLDHVNYNEKLGNHYAYLEAFDKLWDFVAVVRHFSSIAINQNINKD